MFAISLANDDACTFIVWLVFHSIKSVMICRIPSTRLWALFFYRANANANQLHHSRALFLIILDFISCNRPLNYLKTKCLCEQILNQLMQRLTRALFPKRSMLVKSIATILFTRAIANFRAIDEFYPQKSVANWTFCCVFIFA